MRFVRYQSKDDAPRYGWILSDPTSGDKVGPVEGNPFGEFRRLEATLPLSSVRLLAPVQPSKIINVGRNYFAHAKEHDAEVPEIPLLFLKPPSSLIGIGDTIRLPPQSQQVEHEGELVVVIGKRGRYIPLERTPDHIFGYTVGNDVTARDLQRKDGQWTRSKGFDTFCSIGPWIETDFDPSDALLTCHVNDGLRQMSSTREMAFHVNQLVAFASTVMTLEPGDILMTGTPSGVGPLLPGDIVKVEIKGLGILQNPVAAEETH